jgi:hypothetical protein
LRDDLAVESRLRVKELTTFPNKHSSLMRAGPRTAVAT